MTQYRGGGGGGGGGRGGKTLQIAALFADNNSFLNMHIVRMHHPFNFCFASDYLKLDFPTSHYATDWLLGGSH